MTSVQKINIQNLVSRQNVKNVLGYAVKNRKGYYKHIKRVDNKLGETLDQFESVGFINTGYTQRSETYSITSLGDQYYKDMFGTLDYLGKRLSGIFERFLKKHI